MHLNEHEREMTYRLPERSAVPTSKISRSSCANKPETFPFPVQQLPVSFRTNIETNVQVTTIKKQIAPSQSRDIEPFGRESYR